jgi:hypothetical protein
VARCVQNDTGFSMEEDSIGMDMRFVKDRSDGSLLGLFDVTRIRITLSQEGKVRACTQPKAGFSIPRQSRVARVVISSPAWRLRPE